MENSRNSYSVVKKFFGGIVLSFIIMGLFIGIQIVPAAIAVAFKAITYVIEAGPDIDADTLTWEIQQNLLQGSFMTSLTAVITAISAVFAVFFYWLIHGRKKTAGDRRFFKEEVLKAKHVLMIAVAAFGLYYLTALIASVIGVLLPDTMEEYSEMMNLALGGSEILAILAAVILAPLNEECIMRGLILKNLQKYFSDPVAIVIQAVLFGIFHMNLVQGIYVLPVGLALGYVAVKSRSVLPCMLMHLLFNLMSFVSGVLPVFFQTGLFCVLAFAASAAVVWFTYRKDMRRKREQA